MRNWVYVGVGYSLLVDNTQQHRRTVRIPEAADVCAARADVLDCSRSCSVGAVARACGSLLLASSLRWSSRRAATPPSTSIASGEVGSAGRSHRHRRHLRRARLRRDRADRAPSASRPTAPSTIRWPAALQVAGLRTGEIQQLLVDKLKDRYLKDPQVIVTVKDRNSQKISVLGQVAKPGQVGYYPNMTIVDAIASAGGFTGHRREELGQPAPRGRRQDRDARLSGRRHQRGTLSKRDGSAW